MTQAAGERRDDDPWAEDARRVLRLIETVGEQYARRAGAARPADGAASDGLPADHPPECTWCPVCQALTLARRAGPDLLERVAEVAAGLAASIRAHPGGGPAAAPPDDRADDGGNGGADDGDEAAGDGAPAPGARRPRPHPPGTERIEITD